MTGGRLRPDLAETWTVARRLFEAAIDLPEHERGSFIERECGANRALKATVLDLIDSDAHSLDFLNTTPGGMIRRAMPGGVPDLTGQVIGPFRVTRLVAHGGMGAVYEAVQDHPRRTVALKVLKSAWSGPSVLRRFEVEAEILARMKHPNIAQVHAAGVHRLSSGPLQLDLPWYALEYVEGAADLVADAARRRLDVVERVQLFITVCAAVHHAHQRGVIHRDLKASNVLVGSDGRPRLIDFGVARTVTSELELATMHTLPGELVGTLSTMAPEQLSGDAGQVDVRVDVYALGAILYELLTGRPPLELSGLSLVDAAQAVRERTPPEPRAVVPGLPRELGWITMRALAKEKERRYSSAAELGADLTRFIEHEPVEASPPSVAYRTWKFVRRNRVAVTGGVLLLAALIGWGISNWFARRTAERAETRAADRARDADLARDQARIETGKAREAVDFFKVMISEAARPEPGRAAPTLLDVLHRGVRFLDDTTLYSPDVEGELRLSLAGILRWLDDQDEAARQYRIGLERIDQAGRGDTSAAVEARADFARLLAARGRDEEAADVTAAVPEKTSDDPFNAAHVSLKLNEAVQLFDAGRFADAERVLNEAHDAYARRFGANNDQALGCRSVLAKILWEIGRYADAERITREVLDATVKLHGEDAILSWDERLTLAKIALDTGRPAEALVMLDGLVAAWGKQLGPNDAAVWRARYWRGRALTDVGRIDEAKSELEAVIATQRTKAPRSFELVVALEQIARVRLAAGEGADAAEPIDEARRLLLDLAAEGSFEMARFDVTRGVVLRAIGKSDEAEAALTVAVAILDERFAPGYARREEALRELIALCEDRRDAAGAAKWRSALENGGRK